MKTGPAIAEILKKEGVEYLFAYPVNHLIEACAAVDIRPIIVRQERIGLHMADAMSRLSKGRKMGVFCMQSGPGSENAYGGIAQAFGESIPLLSRICAIAQNLDLFATINGPEAAIAVLRERSGRWFDPALVEAAERLHTEQTLWRDCMAGDSLARCRELVMRMAPSAAAPVPGPSVKAEVTALSAVVSSPGMTQNVLPGPAAICGSVCRYW